MLGLASNGKQLPVGQILRAEGLTLMCAEGLTFVRAEGLTFVRAEGLTSVQAVVHCHSQKQ